MKFEVIISLVFLLIILIINLRSAFQNRSWGWLGSLIQLYHLSFAMFGIVQLLYYIDFLPHPDFVRYSKALILLSSFTYLTQVVLLKIAEISDKKVKTLWRLPLIGLLLGMLLEFNWVFLIHALVIFTAFILVLLEKKRLEYLLRKLVLPTIISFSFIYFAFVQETGVAVIVSQCFLALSSLSLTRLVRAKQILGMS